MQPSVSNQTINQNYVRGKDIAEVNREAKRE